MSFKSVVFAFTIVQTVVSFSTTPKNILFGNRLTSLFNNNENIIIANEDGDVKRRNFLLSGAASLIFSSSLMSSPSIAEASGGATAGKYTTIPIAKRRYYGRVQQAVHEFLELGPEVVNGDIQGSTVQKFFDPQGIVVVPAKDSFINGVCTKKDGKCKGQEIRDSRYNDMKASMYLLANAFRINQQKAPDNLPTVKAAKAFFKEMDGMEKIAKNPKKGTAQGLKQFYVNALNIMDGYLDLVELPPIDSGHYDKEFSTLVGEKPRLT